MEATTYLASHPPPVGDPKSAMRKSVLATLGLVGAALHDEAPVEPKKKAAVKFTRIPTPSYARTSTIFLDIIRAQGVAAATMTLETISPSARSTRRAPNVLVQPNPMRITM